MESDYFKKAMKKYKYKLNVGIAINLIRKKTKKAAMSKLNWSRQVVRNSQGVVYKGINDPSGNWTKQSNQQLMKEINLLLQHLSLLHSTLYPLPDLNQDLKFR